MKLQRDILVAIALGLASASSAGCTVRGGQVTYDFTDGRGWPTDQVINVAAGALRADLSRRDARVVPAPLHIEADEVTVSMAVTSAEVPQGGNGPAFGPTCGDEQLSYWGALQRSEVGLAWGIIVIPSDRSGLRALLPLGDPDPTLWKAGANEIAVHCSNALSEDPLVSVVINGVVMGGAHDSEFEGELTFTSVGANVDGSPLRPQERASVVVDEFEVEYDSSKGQ